MKRKKSYPDRIAPPACRNYDMLTFLKDKLRIYIGYCKVETFWFLLLNEQPIEYL